MVAIVSSTYDSKYFYFLPIISWCWHKIGVKTICFLPEPISAEQVKEIGRKEHLVSKVLKEQGIIGNWFQFSCPENKQATYAQCSRLYGAALDLPEDEVLILGDIDMCVFRTDFIVKSADDFFDIYGADLVPNGQMPICYAVGTVKTWRRFFTKGRTYQECLDAELGHEEMENMRGNLWSRDQELLAKGVGELCFKHNRSNGITPFAQNRIDRDDAYWRDRLGENIIDAHLWRDGFEEQNHANIMELLRYMYPSEDLSWIDNYRNEYIKLL